MEGWSLGAKLFSRLSPKIQIRISTETRGRKVRKGTEGKEGGNGFHGKSRSLDWRTRVSDGGGAATATATDETDVQTRLCPRAA